MNIISLLISTLRMSIPLIIAAMGGVFATRCGMMALGLEGMMLMGAFGGVYLSYLSGSALIGFGGGILFGLLNGLLYALLAVRLRVNQVICGIGMNLLALSGTTVLMQFVWKNSGNSPNVAGVSGVVELPILRHIPYLNEMLGAMSINFYLAILAVLGTWYVIFRTSFGLRLRMVGENPTAASTLGIGVRKYKFIAMALCGMLAGYAGAYLSLDQLNLFSKDMVSGRGFIVTVMLALGKYYPQGVVVAALLFGFADALQINLQQLYSFPSQLVHMVPYVVTLLVLTFGVRHVKAPAGMGQLPDE